MMSSRIEATDTAPTPSAAPADANDVNCLNIRAVYDYLLRKIPDRADELFDNLPGRYGAIENPQIELTDENNWVPSEIAVFAFKRAKELLGDPEAPYHIGYESVTTHRLGYIQKFFITTFGSPGGVLKRINHVNSQFNATKVVETIYSSPARAVVRLHWKDNRVLSRDLCRFNRGIYAAIPTIWKMPPGTIEEPYCQFAGDPYCQFNINFHTGRRPFSLTSTLLRTRKSQLFSALEQIDNDKLILKKRYDEVQMLNMQLADKVEKLQAINTASNLLVSRENTDEILETTMRFVVNIMKFDRAIIMLVDHDRTKLEFRYAVGADPEAVDAHLRDYVIPLDREDNILARVARRGRPTLIKNAREAGLRRQNRILANFDVSSFVICPLLASEGIIGILAADRHRRRERIEPKDLDELSIFANTIAETLLKAQLREEIEAGYVNTVRALVRAIEEKDAYTRGHSERVASLSVEIGRRLGLGKQELEYLRLGCLLHDVGKIGVSESIVRSPKSLSSAEYNIIKLHPTKGAEIVRPVGFLKDHLYLIRNHHEWNDGSGYPDGLAGDRIPLGARIVALADAYDAMTSTRPYRKGMPPEEAAGIIDEASGTQFSPEVVAAFRAVYAHSLAASGG